MLFGPSLEVNVTVICHDIQVYVRLQQQVSRFNQESSQNSMEYKEREEYWQPYKANGQKATVQIKGDEAYRAQCKLWL